jgi:voltage-gated potassium channel Kch
MGEKILIGAALIVVSTFIHSGCTLVAMWGLEKSAHVRSLWVRVSHIAALVLLMFLASVVEVALWAATYLQLGAIEGFEKALYFSMVTFTTLGYGEIVLGENWRLLASFEAANGIIMFGWTTALIVAFVHFFVKHEDSIDERRAS